MDTAMRQKGQQLTRAAAEGDIKALRQALAEGADVHFEEDLPLRTAAMTGHLDCLGALIAAGADVTVRFNEALFYAAQAGDRKMVDCLLDHGAEIDIVMKFHGKKMDQACVALLEGKSLRDSFEKAKEDQGVISKLADSVHDSGLRFKPRPSQPPK